MILPVQLSELVFLIVLAAISPDSPSFVLNLT